ncbi:MAG: hypothetical protein IJ087_12525 [Eggerthellaceae bacterium]|nr:hypothetical protein [Eggerthellaceae bacterium]
MLVANLIKNMLFSGDFSGYFSTFAPSAADEPEPVVLAEGPFERESRIEGEERGTVPMSVLVVREDAEEAESLAIALEAFLRGAEWEPFSESGPWRIVGLDTTAPAFRERDSSGRFVYEFTVEVTAVRAV